jgi:hypothetical protein
VSTFLRWGVFGILGVAALMYAYNASKRLAEARTVTPAAPAASAAASTTPAEPVAEPPASPATPVPMQAEARSTASPDCETELAVARRAIDMRKQGEPLDRVLRIQEVAWQESVERRQRLEKVAARWFGYEGDFAPEALRIAVISDCVQHSPVP